jgi:hypothetical protein
MDRPLQSLSIHSQISLTFTPTPLEVAESSIVALIIFSVFCYHEYCSSSLNDPDWFDLADEAAHNADLDNTEQLPPPPEVIELDDDDDIVYVPPHTATSPFVKQEPITTIQPPTKSTRTSVHDRRPPRHLNDFHMFTTVANEHCQPPEHPYHTAEGTDVDLAIQDEKRMAHLCHFVMVHTATSLH